MNARQDAVKCRTQIKALQEMDTCIAPHCYMLYAAENLIFYRCKPVCTILLNGISVFVGSKIMLRQIHKFSLYIFRRGGLSSSDGGAVAPPAPPLAPPLNDTQQFSSTARRLLLLLSIYVVNNTVKISYSSNLAKYKIFSILNLALPFTKNAFSLEMRLSPVRTVRQCGSAPVRHVWSYWSKF